MHPNGISNLGVLQPNSSMPAWISTEAITINARCAMQSKQKKLSALLLLPSVVFMTIALVKPWYSSAHAAHVVGGMKWFIRDIMNSVSSNLVNS